MELVDHKLTITKYLLEAKTYPNNEHHLPLHKHCMANDQSEILKLYIKLYKKYGANLDVTDHMGLTALMIASGARECRLKPLKESEALGNVQAVRVLVDAGASINLKCKFGLTALDYAKYMLNSSNFVEIDTGKTPIIFTAERREKTMASYQLIIDILTNGLTNESKTLAATSRCDQIQEYAKRSKL